MLISSTLFFIIFVICSLAFETQNNSSRSNQDTLRNAYSFLSVYEKAKQFRWISTTFDGIYREEMKTDEINLLNSILHQIKNRWDFESSIQDIRILHRILCTSELYSIEGPRILKQWIWEMGSSDCLHLHSLRVGIIRRVKNALRLIPIPIHTPPSPKWHEFNVLDPFTKALIRNSCIIFQDLVIPTMHHDADRKLALLWSEHLWQHLSIQHADRPSLPPLNTAFNFDDGPRSRYLLHLITMDYGLTMIHPFYLNKIWHRKDHWQTLWTAKCVFDRKARKCLVNTSDEFLFDEIYDLFTAKFLIMACFNSYQDRNFAHSVQETNALKHSVHYLHHHQHRDALYQLLSGIKSKLPVVLSIVLQWTTSWHQLIYGPSTDIVDWEQGIDLLSVGCAVLMTKSDGNNKWINQERARKVIESAVHWIIERQESERGDDYNANNANQKVSRSMEIMEELAINEHLHNRSAWTFIPGIHKAFPWIIPRYNQKLECKRYLQAVHEICTKVSPSKQHESKESLRKRTGDDIALSVLKPFCRFEVTMDNSSLSDWWTSSSYPVE